VLLRRPGRVRLVKGAYDMPLDVALARDDPDMHARYDRQAAWLIRSGHECSIATHDPERLDAVDRLVTDEGLQDRPYLIEVLSGLGPGQLDHMHRLGHPTQEYLVYGSEWWLYVCNRIAEDPLRLFDALLDAAGTEGHQAPTRDARGNRGW
jgi:proline dehydrogenase